jgi:hypothetical protein
MGLTLRVTQVVRATYLPVTPLEREYHDIGTTSFSRRVGLMEVVDSVTGGARLAVLNQRPPPHGLG